MTFGWLAVAGALVPSPPATQAPADSAAAYRVSFPNAVHHEAEISVTFHAVPRGPLQVRMSRSSPGRYAVHEFAKNVYHVRVADGQGRTLTITRPDPYEWDVSGHDGTVTVSYTLFGDRAGGTYSGIDLTHAHLNMPATFMWARGMRARPIRVRFDVPAGSSWRAATQLAPTDDALAFTARDLDYFMDSPTELSDYTLREWTVGSGDRAARMRLALHHAGSATEADAYLEMAKAVVGEEMAVFGELAPYDYGTYTFIADYLPWVSGDGMEHRNSTIIASTSSLASNAVGVLGTLAHEFFHSWNMERLRSKALEPFDFERANMSGELWFGEGFTSYYGTLILRRAGYQDDREFAGSIGSTLNAVINGSGRRFFSPVEMSMQAPFTDAATSIDPTNLTNTFISYYTWGSAIGLGLDLTLRSRFPGKSLDGYMRLAWQRLGKPEHYYVLADLQALLAQYTGDAAFAEDFFQRFVLGRDVVDYAALLAAAGFRLERAGPGTASLVGPPLADDEDGVLLPSATIVGTPLYVAGLDRGDRITALDGRPVRRTSEIEGIVGMHQPGDVVPIEFVQRGRTRAARVSLVEEPQLVVRSFEDDGRPLPESARAFRDQWLSAKRP